MHCLTGFFVNLYYQIEKEENMRALYPGLSWPFNGIGSVPSRNCSHIICCRMDESKKENAFKGINLCKKLQMAVMTICMPYVLDNV